MMIRRILATGAGGQLGTELARVCLPDGWEMVVLDRRALDLTDPAAIMKRVASEPWVAVINAAAYTAVDQAEGDAIAAWTVNALAPAAFGAACVKTDTPLIQLSTDYVFGGDKRGAWDVDDCVAPLSVYGASKLGGELAVRTSGARHVIARTAWLVSAHGGNFVKTMLRLGAERDVINVVDDQRGSPTSAADVAAALARMAIRLADDPAAPTGTFHVANAGAVSWAQFAEEIFRQSAARGGPSARVQPIATADYPTPARRPANSLLATDATRAAFGIDLRAWQLALGDILDELVGPAMEIGV